MTSAAVGGERPARDAAVATRRLPVVGGSLEVLGGLGLVQARQRGDDGGVREAFEPQGVQDQEPGVGRRRHEHDVSGQTG